MKTKDIEVGKYYSMEIWDDEEPTFFKCINYNKEEGCFELLECSYYGYDWEKNPEEVCPWLIYPSNTNMSTLKEIPEMRYIIRSMGLLIERNIIREVQELKKLPYQEP